MKPVRHRNPTGRRVLWSAMDGERIAPGASPVNDEFEVGFDADFEDRWARAANVGRWGLAVIVVLALTGLLGGGPLDHRTIGSLADGGSVDYQPVIRFGSTTQITVHLPPGVDTIHVDQAFIEPLGLQQVSPDAVQQRADGGGALLVFRPATTITENLVRLRGKPSVAGLVPVSLMIGDHVVRQWTEVILP